MDDLRMQSVGNRRTALILLGTFSALALVLAVIGIYGVVAYSVAQRGQEIGIRAALGAQQGDILKMVLAQGGRIAVVGAVAGLVAAALTRLMSGLLYSVKRVRPADVCGRVRCADGRRPAGELCTRAQGGAGRSDGGAALRLTRRRRHPAAAPRRGRAPNYRSEEVTASPAPAPG